MLSIIGRAKALNDGFAEQAGKVLSWSIWFTIMVLGTVIWIAAHEWTRGVFDSDWSHLVLVLTIVTALDAGATKLFQLSLRRQDEKADHQLMLLLESLAALTVSIREELDHSKDRDEAAKVRDEDAAKRDESKRQLFEEILNVLKNLKGKRNGS